MDITVSRNLYGRQIGSFEGTVQLKEPQLFSKPDIPAVSPSIASANKALKEDEFHGVFIRAPGIKSVDAPDVCILATIEDSVVGVRQDNLIVTAFHPELTKDLRWHLYFVQTVLNYCHIDINVL